MDMGSSIKTNMKKWAQTSDSYFAQLLSGKIFHSTPPSAEEIRKRDFHENFDALLYGFPSLSPEKIKEIYETLQKAKTSLATK